MNFENLNSQLSAFGEIEYLGHNGDDQSRVIVSVLNVDPNAQNVDNLTNTINAFVSVDFPVVEYSQLIENNFKAVYLAQQ